MSVTLEEATVGRADKVTHHFLGYSRIFVCYII